MIQHNTPLPRAWWETGIWRTLENIVWSCLRSMYFGDDPGRDCIWFVALAFSWVWIAFFRAVFEPDRNLFVVETNPRTFIDEEVVCSRYHPRKVGFSQCSRTSGGSYTWAKGGMVIVIVCHVWRVLIWWSGSIKSFGRFCSSPELASQRS